MRTIRWVLLCVALGTALAGSCILPGAILPLERALDDWRIRSISPSQPESRIVIVDIDERSLAEQGAWPWPRAAMARLLQTLIDDYGVAGIAIDAVFPEQRPDDSLLAAQLKREPVTSAIVYDLEQQHSTRQIQALPPAMTLLAPLHAPKATGHPAVANHPDLGNGRTGHITPLFDADGTVRRLYPLICPTEKLPSIEAGCHATLALSAYASLLDKPRLRLHEGYTPLSPHWQLELQDGDTSLLTLPLNQKGKLTIPYRHTRQDWLSVSATDILHRRPSPDMLKGVIVLLGGTALGMTDIISTPRSPVAAGIEPHAEILSALLDNAFLTQPRWGWLIDAILLLPFAMLLAWSLDKYDTPAQRVIVLPLWLLLTWTGSGALATLALHRASLLLPLPPLFLFPPLALLLLFCAELYRASRQSAGILALLSAYLPRQVAGLLAKSVGNAINNNADASRREITVLFADINHFATLCENLPPETVAQLMQRVFTEMAEAVVAHHGTIDKFIGDAIMAFWNAPNDDPEHARRALAAARTIQQRATQLAPFCQSLGLAPITIGIGIESGYAFVGNFGSTHRRTYTALGEPVILASRIEALTATLQQPILIGPGCAALLGKHHLTPLGAIPVRGRAQQVELYKPEPE